MLEVSLRHRFDDFTLDVDLALPSGLTVLFGRSGSGKSTVIKSVAGLLRPDEGRVVVGGKVLGDTSRGLWLPPHKRGLGVIFQEGRLFPHLTVRQNLLYGHRAGRGDLAEVVDMLGIGALLQRRPAGLSGGEQQRVAIGRALLAGPDLILADEPLAALDEARKADILPYFERLRDRACPILYVTHSPAEVARLANHVVVLDAGRVLRQGSARDILGDPELVPAGIRGVGAVLEARVAQHHDDGLTELDAGGVPLFLPRVASPVGAMIRVRIAAQEVILSRTRPEGLSALNILSGKIDSIRAGDGPGALVALKTPAGRILARITRRSAEALDLHEGAPCHAVVKTVAIAREDIGQG